MSETCPVCNYMRDDLAPCKCGEYAKAASSFAAPAGSPPTWAECEQTFWSMEKELRAGNADAFRKLQLKYKEQLAEFEKAEAENDQADR